MASTSKLTPAFTRALRAATPRLTPGRHLPPSFLAPSWSSSHSQLVPTTPLRSLHTTPLSRKAQLSTDPVPESSSTESAAKKTAIGRIDRRLQISFTCTAAVPVDGRTIAELAPGEEVDGKQCGHRSTHEFSRRSYEKGIVIIECPGCANRHLIADNLQWFSQTPSAAYPEGQPIGQETKTRTVEDLMKEKGEQVKWEDGGLQGGTWTLE